MTELMIKGSQADIECLTHNIHQRNCGTASLVKGKTINKAATDWDIPMGRNIRSRKDLRDHLCSLGYRTDGGGCPNCTSQCAWGREYAARFDPIPPIVHVRTTVIATTPEGAVRLFASFSDAARQFHVSNKDRFGAAARSGQLYKGYFWHREDLITKEESE